MTGVRAVTSVLAVALLTAGCGSDVPEDTDTTSSTSSASTTSAPSSSSASSSTSEATSEPTADQGTSTADQGTSTGAVVAYVEMGDELASSPGEDLTQLSEVARGQARRDRTRTLSLQRSKGWRQEGRTGVDDLREKSSTTDEATVSVCIDYSDVDVLDETGTSVVADDRQDRVLHSYTVVRDDTTDDWLVSEITEGGPRC